MKAFIYQIKWTKLIIEAVFVIATAVSILQLLTNDFLRTAVLTVAILWMAINVALLIEELPK